MISARTIKWVVISGMLSVQLISAQTNYYVSPTGNDNNTGSLNAPFATIAKARDAVRTVNANMAADINVYLRGGWYVQSATLAFTQADGGTNGKNVIYQAYPNEYPVISGGKRITGWTLHDATKNIWKAPAPGLNTRQLYVNCVRAVRAHKGAGLGSSKRTYGYRIYDTTMQHWKNPTDIEMIFNGYGINGGAGSGNPQWTERRCGVASISDTQMVLKQPCWGNSSGSNQGITSSPNDYENAWELLDQPGEWYWDRSVSTVYYIPRTGDNMTTATVIAPVLETLVSATGALGSPITNMQFKGITFAHATFMRPSGNDGWPELQACYMRSSPNRTPGNVSLSTATNFRFERCVFKHLGAVGLDMFNGSQNNVVVGCVFTDISANCIQIGNTTDPGRSNTQARDINNQILNCYIHDSPAEYRGGCGVMCGYVANTLISHNDIANTPYTGVSIGWGWGVNSYMANNVTSYNHIYHTLASLGDGGNFYSLSAQTNSKLNNNYLHDNHHVQGTIYLDEATQYYEVYRNVCSQVVQNWVHMNNMNNDIADINVHDNYSTTSATLVGGTNVLMTNNMTISIGAFPLAARQIVDSAGIELAWRDALTRPCGCSVSLLDTASQPRIVNGHMVDATHIAVFFDRAMDVSSASSAANYAVNSGVTISAVTIGNDATEFVLTTSSLSESSTYTVTINNVRGSGPQGKTISPNSTVQVTGFGNGLIGWWKLDETSGTIAHDASGFNHDGVLSSDTSLVWTAGKIANGMQFKGTNSTVTIPAEALGPISATGDLTIAMWANPVFIDYYLNVFTSSNTILRCTIKKQQFQVTVGQSATLTNYLPGYENFDYGTWEHIALVKRNGNAELYRNGVLKATWTAGAMSNQSIILGGLTGGGALAYKGLLDDVRLYNRALSDNELLSLTQGAQGPNVVGVEHRPMQLKKSAKSSEISVFNCKGMLVKQGTSSTINKSVSKMKLTRGMYLVKIKMENKMSVEKMIVVGNRPVDVARISK